MTLPRKSVEKVENVFYGVCSPNHTCQVKEKE